MCIVQAHLVLAALEGGKPSGRHHSHARGCHSAADTTLLGNNGSGGGSGGGSGRGLECGRGLRGGEGGLGGLEPVCVCVCV